MLKMCTEKYYDRQGTSNVKTLINQTQNGCTDFAITHTCILRKSCPALS